MKPTPEIIPITPGSWRIEDETVRLFLFEGAERALLVDSGKTLDNAYELAHSLTARPLVLVNTHADFDHIACNGQFETVYLHPSEYAFYYKEQHQRKKTLPLWDGETIDLGGRQFEVIAVPGHTMGSIALLNREERFLVGGDGIQNGTIYLYGPQRELLAYRYSLERLWKRRDEFDWVYPSHAEFPQPTAQIGALIEGVARMQRGEVTPVQTESFGIPVKRYDLGPASILYDDDISFPEPDTL